MSPKISVVMPVWNGEKYLGEAIDSILAQQFSDFELIVVDDGSDDGTEEILRSYRDARLKIHRLEHAGIVSALNFGVSQSQADWIARQDADDVSLPARFEQQWRALRQNPEAVLCFTDHSLLNESSDAVGAARLPRTRSLQALRLCFQCPFAHSTVLFSKEAFNAAGGYREAERHAEDFGLWGRMLELGEFVGLAQDLLKFRVHAISVSRQNLEKQKALTEHIAAEHCARFMRLEPGEAERAARILRTATPQRKWADWLWFLTHCAPRLRWKSTETAAWLTWQTVKQLGRFSD